MWKYLPVTNACIQVLLTIGLGSLFSYANIFDDTFVSISVKFVFWMALPCLVMKGIGIGVDFYSDAFLWDYILAFLVIRAIALGLSFVLAAFCDRDQKGIGDVAVKWLNFTWISTVIMGIPILSAVLNNPAKGQFYGLLAGISSYIFQLPLQLCFLEASILERQWSPPDHVNKRNFDDIETSGSKIEDLEDPQRERDDRNNAQGHDDAEPPRECAVEAHNSLHPNRLLSWLQLIKRGDIWRKISLKILHNPVLWGVALGFIISLSTFGHEYLWPGPPNHPNSSKIDGLDWFDATLSWFGDCVSPVSLFAMGVWMHRRGGNLITVGIPDLAISMVIKMVIIPLMMVGLAGPHAFNLPSEAGRAAVLIAALPISQASFALGKQYSIGEASLSANVTVGTFLMLPVLLLWIVVLDAWGLFVL